MIKQPALMQRYGARVYVGMVPLDMVVVLNVVLPMFCKRSVTPKQSASGWRCVVYLCYGINANVAPLLFKKWWCHTKQTTLTWCCDARVYLAWRWRVQVRFSWRCRPYALNFDTISCQAASR